MSQQRAVEVSVPGCTPRVKTSSPLVRRERWVSWAPGHCSRGPACEVVVPSQLRDCQPIRHRSFSFPSSVRSSRCAYRTERWTANLRWSLGSAVGHRPLTPSFLLRDLQRPFLSSLSWWSLLFLSQRGQKPSEGTPVLPATYSDPTSSAFPSCVISEVLGVRSHSSTCSVVPLSPLLKTCPHVLSLLSRSALESAAFKTDRSPHFTLLSLTSAELSQSCVFTFPRLSAHLDMCPRSSCLSVSLVSS